MEFIWLYNLKPGIIRANCEGLLAAVTGKATGSPALVITPPAAAVAGVAADLGCFCRNLESFLPTGL